MKIKTFYSKSMPEALREIKSQLGPEAVILSTKEVPRKSGIWGGSSGFEVVAARDDSDDIDVSYSGQKLQSARSEIDLSSVGNANGFPGDESAGIYSRDSLKIAKDTCSNRFTDPEEGISKPAACIYGKEFPEPEPSFMNRVSTNLYRDLVDCGVDERLACTLLSRACENLSVEQRQSRSEILSAVRQATLSLLAAPASQSEMPGKKIVAFVGPTGVGKTTTIAKLAARLVLQKKKKAVLITMDRYRIGAIEQLRILAGLMGIGFRFVGQVSELAQAIEENKQRDYILIDTAGRGPKDMKAMNGLASFLKQSKAVECHLVMSASTKAPDMRRIMDQFEVCKPDYLLFTKLDETSTPGPILNELVRTQKSFSYYTDGQKVPDDFHFVPNDRIIDIVLKQNVNPI
jgi:flagellar biosynthesis protein FlhF